MKKITKIVSIILAIVGVCFFYFYSFLVGRYNEFVCAEEQVKATWAQVENIYRRMLNLISNLVEVVRDYAKDEEEFFVKIVEARSKAGGILNISKDILNNTEDFEKNQRIQSELSFSLQRFFVVSENYDKLKANESFVALQSQVEETENRTTMEGKVCNDICNNFNTNISLFLASIIANMYSFRESLYFKADEQVSKAPNIKFY